MVIARCRSSALLIVFPIYPSDAPRPLDDDLGWTSHFTVTTIRRFCSREQPRMYRSDGFDDCHKQSFDFRRRDAHLPPMRFSGLSAFKVLAVNDAEVVRNRMALLKRPVQKAPVHIGGDYDAKQLCKLLLRSCDALERIADLLQLSLDLIDRVAAAFEPAPRHRLHRCLEY